MLRWNFAAILQFFVLAVILCPAAKGDTVTVTSNPPVAKLTARQTATFTAVVRQAHPTDKTPVTYQWYVNSDTQPGATNSTFTTSFDPGVYIVWCAAAIISGSGHTSTCTGGTESFTVPKPAAVVTPFNSAGDFGLSASRTSGNVVKGNAFTTNANVWSDNNYSGTVIYSLTGPDSSEFTISVSNDNCPGSATVTITPASNLTNRKCDLTLNVSCSPLVAMTPASVPLTITVTDTATTTTTTVFASPNPSTYRISVTFTATVSPIVPDGETVTFYDGATSIGSGTTAGGAATFSTASLTSGSHTVTAKYVGDTNYSASTSAGFTQTVNNIATPTTTTLDSSPNPSTYDSSVTFTATVNPSVPAGETVTFYDSGTQIGKGTTSGSVATLATSYLTAGAHSVTATYAGDPNYATSTSSTFTQTVNAAPTTTTLTSSLNPSTYGILVSFTATVQSASGDSVSDGTVTFYDNDIELTRLRLGALRA